MEFFVLGELAVRDGERVIALKGRRLRSILAVLLVQANRVVPAGTLVDAVWPDRRPTTASNTLQVHLRSLRNALEPGRSARDGGELIIPEAAGYRLRVRPEELDADRFERLAADGHATAV